MLGHEGAKRRCKIVPGVMDQCQGILCRAFHITFQEMVELHLPSFCARILLYLERWRSHGIRESV